MAKDYKESFLSRIQKENNDEYERQRLRQEALQKQERERQEAIQTSKNNILTKAAERGLNVKYGSLGTTIDSEGNKVKQLGNTLGLDNNIKEITSGSRLKVGDKNTPEKNPLLNTYKKQTDFADFLNSDEIKEERNTLAELGNPIQTLAPHQNKTYSYFKKAEGNALQQIGGTILDTGVNIGRGFLSFVEGMVDTLPYIEADIIDLFPGETAKGVAKSMRKRAMVDSVGAIFGDYEDNTKNLFERKVLDDGSFDKSWAEKIDTYSTFDQGMDQVAQGVGQQLATMGTVGVISKAGLTPKIQSTLIQNGVKAEKAAKIAESVATGATSYSSAFGSTYSSLLNAGYDAKTARAQARISGFTEALSEQLHDGIPGTKTAGWADKVYDKFAKSRAMKAVFNSIGEMDEEVFNNVVMTVINDVYKALDPDNEYLKNNDKYTGHLFQDVLNNTFSEESLNEYFNVALSSLITNTGSIVGQNINKENIIKEYAKENNIKYETAAKRLGIEINTNNEITTNKSRLYNDMVQSLEQANGRELSETNKREIQNLVYSIKDSKINKVSKEQLLDLFDTYKTAQTDAFQDQAIELYPNLNEQDRVLYNNLINDISDIIYDTGFNVRFNPNMNVVARTEGNMIEINPPTTYMPIKEIVMHEIAHHYTTNGTSNYVLNNLKKNGMYETIKKDLLSIKDQNGNSYYNEKNVDDEIVARELSKIFENEKATKTLFDSNPSFFKSIGTEIQALAANLSSKRNTKDATYLNKLAGMFRNDFQMQNDSLKGNEKYTGKTSKEINEEYKRYANSKYDVVDIDTDNMIYYTKDGNKNVIPSDVVDYIKEDPRKAKYLKYTEDPTIFNLPLKAIDGLFSKASGEALKYRNQGETTGIAVYDNYSCDYDIYGEENNNIKLYNGGVDYGSNYDTVVNSSEESTGQSSNNSRKGNEAFLAVNTNKGTSERVSNISQNSELGNNKVQSTTNQTKRNNKTLNPAEIAKLKPEDASTTPKLEERKYNKKGDGLSKQVETLQKSQLFTDEEKQKIINEEEFRTYDKITNKESLNEAYEKLKEDGVTEALRWMNDKSETASATDIAEGVILLKHYADAGDLASMVEVAKKYRQMKTSTAQALQASSILSRMTPEGMVAYAQSELSEAFDQLVKNKTRKWIEENQSKFELTPEEVSFIMDTMQKVVNMEDGYDKKVELAKIQKVMTDKIPPNFTKSLKGWMRLSMLFNFKTQVRNIGGNALIMPVNAGADVFSSVADKILAKKTGVRTTGLTNFKAQGKGAIQGGKESWNDFKLGINTRDMDGNRFEIGEGKSFSDKTAIGRGLNKVESILNFAMDAGDRVFSQAIFENSLQNQMALNKVDKPTQEMIEIATTEALQRTWNDNNKYTKFVLDVRRMLNDLIGGENYGLGDVLIPFAKTPANLTKAIVDYSPVGLVNSIIEYNKLNKAIDRGEFTATQQHKFVQTLGKATAGTILYVLATALANAGVITGKDDEDKDTKNFVKNVLGSNQYSIKIGDKSFTYDWAQPIAAPFSIMANIANSKNNKETALLEAVVASLDTAGSVLLEQSFLQSINDVLNDDNGFVSGLINAVLDLPARAVPTLFKQVADLVDPVQRQTFEYGKPLKTAANKFLVKLPGASKLLAPKVDTMGADILKYGGKNNIFNVMFNPANVNKSNVNEVGQEIYDVYKMTGDGRIMPRVAPYYVNQNGQKVVLSNEQIAEYQRVAGKEIEKSMKEVMNTNDYKKASDTTKASIIKNIVDYSYNLARKDVVKIDMPSSYDRVNKVIEYGGTAGDYYLYNSLLDKDDTTYTKNLKLKNSSINSKAKGAIYESGISKSSLDLYKVLKESNVNINDYLDYLSKEFLSDKDGEGNTITGSKKAKVIYYMNNYSKLTYEQKLLILGRDFTLTDSEQAYIINRINNSKLSKDEKLELLKSLNGVKVNNQGTVRW